MEFFLPGGPQSSQGAAVKGFLQGNNNVARLAASLSLAFEPAILAGQLDGSLICLSPRVAEIHPLHAGGGKKLLGKGQPLVGVVVVGDVNLTSGLLLHRLHQGRVVVSQAVHPDA